MVVGELFLKRIRVQGTIYTIRIIYEPESGSLEWNWERNFDQYQREDTKQARLYMT